MVSSACEFWIKDMPGYDLFPCVLQVQTTLGARIMPAYSFVTPRRHRLEDVEPRITGGETLLRHERIESCRFLCSLPQAALRV